MKGVDIMGHQLKGVFADTCRKVLRYVQGERESGESVMMYMRPGGTLNTETCVVKKKERESEPYRGCTRVKRKLKTDKKKWMI